jgi:hypothetical protein
MWKATVLTNSGEVILLKNISHDDLLKEINDNIKCETWGKNKTLATVYNITDNMTVINSRLTKTEPVCTIYDVLIDAEFKVVISKVTEFEKLVEKRNKILCATDWLFISDVSIPQKHRKAYAEYRTYLRDITKSTNDSNLSIEEFEHWLRRKHPEEFMDGGNSEQIIKRFKAYL